MGVTIGLVGKRIGISGPCEEAAPASDADIVWTDTIHITDKIAPKFTSPADTVHLTDTLAPRFTSADVPHLTDVKTATATASATKSDTIHLPEVLQAFVDNMNVHRSGAPDADPYGDGWVDGLLVNNGVNHGNETPLQVSDQAIIVTERDAFMKWDLRKFVGFSPPAGGTMVLEIWAGHGIAVGVTGHAIFSNKAATDPFTESTLNWTNRPAVGVDVVDKTFFSAFVALGAPPTQTFITLSAAEYSAYLGNWLMIRLTSDAIALSPLNVISREGITATQHPRLSFDLQR